MKRGKMDLSPKAFNLQLDRVDRLLGDADLTRELRDVIEGVNFKLRGEQNRHGYQLKVSRTASLAYCE
jgi:hypothetical protein